MHTTRVDIGMRLAVDADEYERVGKVMDAIDGAVRKALIEQGFQNAAFDFTHFNTHPCKASVMSRAVEEPGILYPGEDGNPSLPPVISRSEF